MLLDELATLKIITINSVVKPYSRIYIAHKLIEAMEQVEKLNTRQRAEIEFYLHDYKFELRERLIITEKPTINTSGSKIQDTVASEQHPASFSYDPLSFNYMNRWLKLSVRPALGARFIVNENGSVWDLTGGGEVFGYVGKHVGYYLNVEQTWQSEALVTPEYFTLEEGKVWTNAGNGSVTNTEWRGGISVAWKWGDFGVYKDRPIWGNGVHGSNILSGHAPSFPFIQLHLKPAKWIEFTYFHGWLNGESTPSATSPRVEEDQSSETSPHPKYMAANIFTVTPWRGLDISFGNSIIYSDINVNPLYLIPFLFYNSADAQKNAYNNFAGSNSQVFLDVSSRQINHLNLYASLFIDEINLSRIFDKNKQSNLFGYKLGFQIFDLFMKNLILSAEYTMTNPLTYKHFISSISFSYDNYSLGHYMRDNSQNIFVDLTYRPFRGFSCSISYDFCKHGAEMYYYPGDNEGFPVLTDISWKFQKISLTASYMILNRVMLLIAFESNSNYGDVKYSPSIIYGKTNQFIAGIKLGL